MCNELKIRFEKQYKCFSIVGNFKTYYQYDLKNIKPPVEKTLQETIRNEKRNRKVNNYFY